MLDPIGQIPAETARIFGSELASIAPGRELSFNELNAQSNLADGLQSTLAAVKDADPSFPGTFHVVPAPQTRESLF